MKTIYKYELEIVDEQSIDMPKGSRVISAQMQNNKLCIWAIVNSTNSNERRSFVIMGTGNPKPEGSLVFIDTVQDGVFVWHVFEKTTMNVIERNIMP